MQPAPPGFVPSPVVVHLAAPRRPPGCRQFHASRPCAASSAHHQAASSAVGRTAGCHPYMCGVWPQHGCQACRLVPWGSLPSAQPLPPRFPTHLSGRLYLPQALSACCRYPTLLWVLLVLRAVRRAPGCTGGLLRWALRCALLPCWLVLANLLACGWAVPPLEARKRPPSRFALAGQARGCRFHHPCVGLPLCNWGQ